ncbi:hypothetical protein OIV83_003973 [Microbotryomycetes sp. JL201]|nr:hypothetical protein OIV83_003973 [Microbotryomycetes sp. JL201]
MADSLARDALLKLALPEDEPRAAINVIEVALDVDNVEVARQNGFRRCLGIVAHKANGREEGAILVYRRPTTPTVIKTVPLLPECEIKISQHKRTSTAPASGSVLEFYITLQWQSQSISFLVDEMPASFIAEVKRLCATDSPKETDGTRHMWLKSYVSSTKVERGPALGRYAGLPAHYSRKKWARHSIRNGFGALSGGVSVEAGTQDSIRIEQESTEERLRWLAARLQDRAFQELDLTAEAMIRYTRNREDAWRVALERAMGPRAVLYQKLHSKQLVGALILVYVLRSEALHVSSIDSAHLATGLMGVMANKGAVGIRLRYKDTWLTFVNSHLAAFMNQTDARNQMFHDIARGLTFQADKIQSRDPWTPSLRPEFERSLGSATVFDTHHLIWFGDLNYRLDLPRDQVAKLVQQRTWDLLFPFDQLNLARRHDLAFSGFKEAELQFPPTFKFDKGTDEYDTSEKQRVPAWTDRVLWMSLDDDSIEAIKYTSHPEIRLSDHKPVSALLKVPVYKVDPLKRTHVLQELIDQLDDIEWDEAPAIKLLPSPIVEFDTVRYMEPASKTVTFVNKGPTIAEWSFVKPLDRTELCQPWLKIEPLTGLILPGHSIDVTLTVHIHNEMASKLNFAIDYSKDLTELLILSFDKRDFFLSVNAKRYERTCFGNSLNRLALLDVPIRSVNRNNLERIYASESMDQGPVSKETGDGITIDEEKPKTRAPDVVRRMVEFLAEHGRSRADLFAAAPDEKLVDRIRECLDTGDEFPLEDMLERTPSTPTPEQDAMELLRRLELEQARSELSESADIGDVQLSPVFSKKEFIDPAAPTSASIKATEPSVAVNTTSVSAEHAQGSKALTKIDTSVSSVAHCLLRFLKSLERPLIVDEAVEEALLVESREDAYGVLSLLPEVHVNTLLYILAFLHNHISQTAWLDKPSNRDVVMSKLAILFSSVVMRNDLKDALPLGITLSSVARRKKRFVFFLLEDPKVAFKEQR